MTSKRIVSHFTPNFRQHAVIRLDFNMSRRCFSYVLLITRTSLLIHFQRWCIISLSSFRFAVFCFGLYLVHFLNCISNCTMSIFLRNLRQTIKAIIIWNFLWFSTNKELDLDFYANQYIYHLDICINHARNICNMFLTL